MAWSPNTPPQKFWYPLSAAPEQVPETTEEWKGSAKPVLVKKVGFFGGEEDSSVNKCFAVQG